MDINAIKITNAIKMTVSKFKTKIDTNEKSEFGLLLRRRKFEQNSMAIIWLIHSLHAAPFLIDSIHVILRI